MPVVCVQYCEEKVVLELLLTICVSGRDFVFRSLVCMPKDFRSELMLY